MVEDGNITDWRLFCTGYEPARPSKTVVRRHGAIGTMTNDTMKVMVMINGNVHQLPRHTS